LFSTDGAHRQGGFSRLRRPSTRMQMAYLAVNDSENDNMSPQKGGMNAVCLLVIKIPFRSARTFGLPSPVRRLDIPDEDRHRHVLYLCMVETLLIVSFEYLNA
jgi:hypothetical protein